MFWNGRTEKHQTSTACLRLFRENRPIPPLPRSRCGVSTSTPKPRAEGRLSPVALCCEPVSAAASVGAGRSPLGSSTRGGSRDKSFCPCHKTGENTGFSPVFFLPVLHGFGVRFGSDSGFSHLVLPVLNRSHPLQHPKRTRFRPFRTISGAFRCFCSLLTCKIFVLVFVHTAA